jgi:hypothetical protein
MLDKHQVSVKTVVAPAPEQSRLAANKPEC